MSDAGNIPWARNIYRRRPGQISQLTNTALPNQNNHINRVHSTRKGLPSQYVRSSNEAHSDAANSESHSIGVSMDHTSKRVDHSLKIPGRIDIRRSGRSSSSGLLIKSDKEFEQEIQEMLRKRRQGSRNSKMSEDVNHETVKQQPNLESRSTNFQTSSMNSTSRWSSTPQRALLAMCASPEEGLISASLELLQTLAANPEPQAIEHLVPEIASKQEIFTVRRDPVVVEQDTNVHIFRALEAATDDGSREEENYSEDDQDEAEIPRSKPKSTRVRLRIVPRNFQMPERPPEWVPDPSGMLRDEWLSEVEYSPKVEAWCRALDSRLWEVFTRVLPSMDPSRMTPAQKKSVPGNYRIPLIKVDRRRYCSPVCIGIDGWKRKPPNMSEEVPEVHPRSERVEDKRVFVDFFSTLPEYQLEDSCGNLQYSAAEGSWPKLSVQKTLANLFQDFETAKQIEESSKFKIMIPESDYSPARANQMNLEQDVNEMQKVPIKKKRGRKPKIVPQPAESTEEPQPRSGLFESSSFEVLKSVLMNHLGEGEAEAEDPFELLAKDMESAGLCDSRPVVNVLGFEGVHQTPNPTSDPLTKKISNTSK